MVNTTNVVTASARTSAFVSSWRAVPRRAASLAVGVVLLLVGSLLTVGASAASAAGGGSIVGKIVNENGGHPADGAAVVDLFHSTGDGSRAKFIEDVSVRSGNYRFDVAPGCYVLVGIAPSGRTFVSGSRWSQNTVCVGSGETKHAPTDTLVGGSQNEVCFERVMRDDFNGSSLDKNNWQAYYSVGNAGYGLRRPDAISVRNGLLTITAKNNSNGVLVSGGMSSKVVQKYGKFRVRIRTSADPGGATSGVALTWPARTDSHRGGGENNFYETLRDTNRDPFYAFVHRPWQDHSQPGTEQEYYRFYADGTQWQTMTLEWTPSSIVITREGPGAKDSEQFTTNETSANLIPDVDHFLALQLDAWKSSNPHTVRMDVDWAEIYRYCG